MGKTRFIAIYLPQFHPVKENDEVWGKGFTEWTNVAQARPLFRGHYQPHIPADMGFYDLRLEETRIEQAELARQYGIEGFCYWYYWFGNGDKILERPFTEVLKSGKPDYPFCLAWANHSWTTGTWTRINNPNSVTTIKEQKYLGAEDYTKFFYDVLPAFKDHRYITVDGKPIFLILSPVSIPDVDVFIKTWRNLAEQNGLKGVYLIGSSPGVSYSNDQSKKDRKHHLPSISETEGLYQKLFDMGFDAINSQNLTRSLIIKEGAFVNFVRTAFNLRTSIKFMKRMKQAEINKNLLTEFDKRNNIFPTIVSNWDRSPRVGKAANVLLTDSTPAVFKEIAKQASEYSANKEDDHKIVFIRSWNEWAEGNHIEPDLKYGRGYLEAIKEVLDEENER